MCNQTEIRIEGYKTSVFRYVKTLFSFEEIGFSQSFTQS